MSEVKTGIETPKPKEPITLPNVVIRPQTPQEALDYLHYVVGRVGYYKQHGQSYTLPPHEVILEAANSQSEINWNSVDRAFLDEVYNSDDFVAGLQVINLESSVVNEALGRLTQLQQQEWFDMRSEYSVLLTLFGPGGSYDPDESKITIMTTQDGKFKRKRPSHTIVHEIVHIGIEDSIVTKFGLTHKEKERVVDNICRFMLGDILENYEVKAIGDSRIDNYVKPEAISNLPDAIGQFTRDNPRT